MTVKEFLVKYNEDHGYDTDDDSLWETLTEASDSVWTGNRSVHRWYITETVVVELDGKFIRFMDYLTLGDIDIGDIDVTFNNVAFVEQKTRTIEELYYVECS